MQIRLFVVLACVMLAVSACVVEPYGGGGRGGYGHDGYSQGGYGGRPDYGRRVWRP
jgi:hypothetical protein